MPERLRAATVYFDGLPPPFFAFDTSLSRALTALAFAASSIKMRSASRGAVSMTISSRKKSTSRLTA